MAFAVTSLSRQLVRFREGLKKFADMNIVGAQGDEFFDRVWKYTQQVVMQRNLQFKIYEDFFQGGDAQKLYFRKYQDEDPADYEHRLDKSVVVNKCRGQINRGIQMLYAADPPERRMDDNEAHARMMRVWEYNSVRSGFFGAALCEEALKFGYALVENRYINTQTRNRVAIRTGEENEKNEVLYVLQESPLVIPIPRVDQKNEMGAVIRLLMQNREDVLWVGSNPQIVGIEYIDDNIWYRWIVKNPENGREATSVQINVRFGTSIYDNRNPYRTINDLFTLYRNPGDSTFNLDGFSDLADMIEPQNTYNEVASDTGHVIAHQTFPILFFAGMEVKKYSRGVSDVMSTKNADAKASIVQWDADLQANSMYLDRLESQMLKVGGHSPVSEGDLDKIGQVRNLKGAMVPDILTTSHKQLFFGEAEKEHARATLSIVEWHENPEYPNVDLYEDKSMDITWHNGYVPEDELTTAEAQTIRIREGIDSVRDIVRTNHPELETEEEINAYLEDNRELLEEFGLLGNANNNIRNGEDQKSTEQIRNT